MIVCSGSQSVGGCLFDTYVRLGISLSKGVSAVEKRVFEVSRMLMAFDRSCYHMNDAILQLVASERGRIDGS